MPIKRKARWELRPAPACVWMLEDVRVRAAQDEGSQAWQPLAPQKTNSLRTGGSAFGAYAGSKQRPAT